MDTQSAYAKAAYEFSYKIGKRAHARMLSSHDIAEFQRHASSEERKAFARGYADAKAKMPRYEKRKPINIFAVATFSAITLFLVSLWACVYQIILALL